ncbi:MAG: adenosine deaminase [Corticimicrobacter sp.]|uniref:adenosine deaminase n=1 Tax=Corticimicrobacter sp. TaxID=2678536 RepID=UPI0032DB66C2
MNLEEFVIALPKAELHLHIEGTLEPEMMFELARRNSVPLPWDSVEETRAAYDFNNLQSFLDLYYAGAAVLLHEQDFHDLALAYLERAHADGVVHAELFFDPQTHTVRGVPFATVLGGLERACAEAQQRWGMSTRLIMSFLRHLSEQEGFATLDEARPHLHRLHGVGLDSSELGHPPAKFERLFAECRTLGLPVVAHAGEEGPPEYIIEALDLLQSRRIDHGVRASEDPALMARLAREQIPLTVCPFSNVRLRVFDTLAEHNLKTLLDAGLNVSINSDDPAYFGGYVAQNYIDTAAALSLSRAELKRIARNSLQASFVSDAQRRPWLERLDSLPD